MEAHPTYRQLMQGRCDSRLQAKHHLTKGKIYKNKTKFNKGERPNIFSKIVAMDGAVYEERPRSFGYFVDAGRQVGPKKTDCWVCVVFSKRTQLFHSFPCSGPTKKAVNYYKPLKE